jgi:hypothetical protein
VENPESTLDLSVVTATEKRLVEIALGVLRSGTDYADFLNSWLCDYGCQILSLNPPRGLLDDLFDENTFKDESADLNFFPTGARTVTVH